MNAKKLGAIGVIIIDDDDDNDPGRLQRIMVKEEEEDEIGEEFPVVFTVKRFWEENFDVKVQGVQKAYVRVVSGGEEGELVD